MMERLASSSCWSVSSANGGMLECYLDLPWSHWKGVNENLTIQSSAASMCSLLMQMDNQTILSLGTETLT